jgi:group I intron endonuclease
MHHIYLYENKINGMVYIGQTINLQARDHGHKYSGGKYGVDAAIKQYGRHNFDLITIEIVDTIKQADLAEAFWIAEARKYLGKDMVYNITDGGLGWTGTKHSEETKEKLSIANKGKIGRKLSKEACHNIAMAKMGEKNPNYGKSPSAETIKKKSDACIGERNPRAKLTEKDVIEIRKLAKSELTPLAISKIFNISQSTINDITLRRTWKHLA